MYFLLIWDTEFQSPYYVGLKTYRSSQKSSHCPSHKIFNLWDKKFMIFQRVSYLFWSMPNVFFLHFHEKAELDFHRFDMKIIKILDHLRRNERPSTSTHFRQGKSKNIVHFLCILVSQIPRIRHLRRKIESGKKNFWCYHLMHNGYPNCEQRVLQRRAWKPNGHFRIVLWKYWLIFPSIRIFSKSKAKLNGIFIHIKLLWKTRLFDLI